MKLSVCFDRSKSTNERVWERENKLIAYLIRFPFVFPDLLLLMCPNLYFFHFRDFKFLLFPEFLFLFQPNLLLFCNPFLNPEKIQVQQYVLILISFVRSESLFFFCHMANVNLSTHKLILPRIIIPIHPCVYEQWEGKKHKIKANLTHHSSFHLSFFSGIYKKHKIHNVKLCTGKTEIFRLFLCTDTHPFLFLFCSPNLLPFGFPDHFFAPQVMTSVFPSFVIFAQEFFAGNAHFDPVWDLIG